MQSSAEFRLLSEHTDVIQEVLHVIYRDVKQFGKVAVLSSNDDLLEQIDEALWRNAADSFVTYELATVGHRSTVNVLLSNELRLVNKRPALCNINYLIEPGDVKFRQITEIVLATPETVDKARRQYKMYRSAGMQVSHVER